LPAQVGPQITRGLYSPTLNEGDDPLDFSRIRPNALARRSDEKLHF